MNMPGMNMPGTNMPGMNMPGTNMPGTNMPGMNMPGMNMPGMNMPGMNMPGMNMPGMNMPGMSKWPCEMSDGMMTYYHDGYCEQILFDGLITSSNKGMIAACFAVFVLLILFEAIKLGREKLLSHARQRQAAGSADKPLSYTGRQPSATVSVRSQMLQAPHALQSLLVLIQTFISYCVMMIFMNYNAWLCLAVVLGSGAGYFLFNWRRATQSNHGNPHDLDLKPMA
ncbi:high affinity copper uptake protein 1-like isoform X12 [Dreissena polymorpha]|uniref:high affinity copper uptake protein 1-like isoform X11 n=1 Tax=Dreissena polymorpha TaxID=45954 RepID=UPI002264F0A0|nr:high affinity copper uptake protein 1-like isoform X11 [Dreissena polymorpha]XP_052220767.1 high affinity copper uptake protein 1-like isoform X12 [Dreissena polymorpha]